ncbi:hypothetical protein O6H91_04G072300 [Diphasiastrum complanatum]|uniref:Uncharacterized protein n=1 Tax=Diphasiastrum complanatum TaxID=34168 RepID=A0ACC2DY09_DIPCM|nr:hypothetical protein O6H91_04G072300 [Diphasiastrum complanatum]
MSDPSSGFYLWEELARSTVPVDSWDLCEVLLSKDANYPGWLLLVPRRANATEIIHLSDEEQIQLIQEISKASKLLQKVFNPDKLNVAAIGNVAQLHIHVVPRFKTDIAWPGPIWGAYPAKEFQNDEHSVLVTKLKSAIEEFH